MNGVKEAIEFYFAATSLKELIRRGQLMWKVNNERKEDVADHIFGAQILAISLKNNLNLDLNLSCVLEMLVVHELEEIKIGDFTLYDNVSKEQKIAMGSEFVSNLLTKLNNKEYYQNMIDDFNTLSSKEAKFAKAIDKLENVLEFKKYADAGQVNLSCATKEMLEEKRVKQILADGISTFDDLWFFYHLPNYEYIGITEEVWKDVIKPINSNPPKND